MAGLCVVLIPQPSLSQGAQLFEVGINAVAKGHGASKLIGRSMNNEKNERIVELDEIIIDRKNVLFAVLGSSFGHVCRSRSTKNKQLIS
jgi:hypothetical protein